MIESILDQILYFERVCLRSLLLVVGVIYFQAVQGTRTMSAQPFAQVYEEGDQRRPGEKSSCFIIIGDVTETRCNLNRHFMHRTLRRYVEKAVRPRLHTTLKQQLEAGTRTRDALHYAIRKQFYVNPFDYDTVDRLLAPMSTRETPDPGDVRTASFVV